MRGRVTLQLTTQYMCENDDVVAIRNSQLLARCDDQKSNRPKHSSEMSSSRCCLLQKIPREPVQYASEMANYVPFFSPACIKGLFITFSQS